MAKRRCISVDVYESENFFELSNSAKVLYIALMLRTDDEGVIINPRNAFRLYNADKSAFEELTESGFVLQVDGVYVIKHWYQHNKIQPSKMTPSIYKEELSKLRVNGKKEYEFVSDFMDFLSEKC